jgi:DNA-binding NarL/FixJ family response regulator
VIRVVLADDQVLVRAGFGALLDAQDDIRQGSGDRVGIDFVDQSEHTLKGVPDRWRLFSVAEPLPGEAHR